MENEQTIELPEPSGFRTRYRSEPGMIGHYPWAYADHQRRRYDRKECEYENLFTEGQVRHAITAALAAKDAEIERLNHSYHQQRDGAQARVDAAVLRALAAEREIERLKAQLAEPAKPEPGEWVEWKGGECPIADGVVFSAKFRDGTVTNQYRHATEYRWSHGGGDLVVPEADIVAYRVFP